jgi:hypothetical protein
MAIELVIKIPEELTKQKVFTSVDLIQTIAPAVHNGTKLPKGHGRLIDADALEKEMTNGINAGNYEEGYETFAHVNNMDDCVECVKYADTIIEADKERKSEV